ncbi:MAG: Glu/Leu/Phe/Val dehydrogenase [Alphaproteobacteria bacterium]|nr:Glu/Leu/Phe/Val dehydrogenase [Alphaproteobacteria bacterium]MCB9984344.1 Glu/Leu/Phe/Val dehydrogenase [Micavibrio sp.]HRK97890.1 Glu/Leu/Phe/Val dehydrogenase dimerization domain-containing protein [Alphaproteobacteria bacterium]
MLSRKVLEVSNHPSFDNHEQIVMFEDETTGLQAIIAVHNTNLGASLGGCRIYPYAELDDAINDVLRLSKGMTYKSALAGLPLGGGKAVIIGNPRQIKSADMMQVFGEAVEQMDGSYITAEDVGSTEADMIEIAKSTSYVAGLPEIGDGEGVAGNPSPVTAYGVYCGLKACAREKYGDPSLSGRKVAIQGMGSVGYALAEYLVKDGVELFIADIHADVLDTAKDQFGQQITILNPSEIHKADVDIFAPCAMGAGLNDWTIPEIKAGIIGGAANNQLAEYRHDQMLKDRGIVYAPDYAINSGGITSVGYEYFWRTKRNPYSYELTHDTMMAHVARIEETLGRIFTLSDNKGIATGESSDQLAEEIFKARASTQTSVA